MAKQAQKDTPELISFGTRIHPRTKVTLDLLSRRMHGTIGQALEWSVIVAGQVRDITTPEGKRMALSDVAEEVWDKDELGAALALARLAPSLLATDQEAMIDAILRSPELRVGEKPREDFLRLHYKRFREMALKTFTLQKREPITRAMLAEKV